MRMRRRTWMSSLRERRGGEGPGRVHHPQLLLSLEGERLLLLLLVLVMAVVLVVMEEELVGLRERGGMRRTAITTRVRRMGRTGLRRMRIRMLKRCGRSRRSRTGWSSRRR